MRKIIYWVHVSLDGHVSGPNGEFDWPVFGPELARYSHEEHARYFAPIWRATPKVVFSRTLTSAAWHTTVLGGDLATEVAA